MTFSNEVFTNCLNIAIIGISCGFTVGFISWGIGFAIYSVVKWFKMA